MKVLLDTHALVWWLGDDPGMGPNTRRAVSDPGNDVLVSIASIWELMIKWRVGKFKGDPLTIMTALPREGLALLPVTTEHITALRDVPMHHRDPFDHLLIAQALVEDATFISSDRMVGRYSVRSMAFSA